MAFFGVTSDDFIPSDVVHETADTVNYGNDSSVWMNHTAYNTHFYNVSQRGGLCMNNKTTSDSIMMIRFLTVVIIRCPIALLGILGNILSFIVLCNQRPRLTTSVLLQGLAVFDTLILASIFTQNLYVIYGCLGTLVAYYNVYHYVFFYSYPLGYFFRITETWLTLLLTIDRYIAVCKPLHAQRICTMSRTYRHMAILILLAAAFSIPRFFEYEIVPGNALHKFEPTAFSNDTYYIVIYKILIFFIIMYLVPVISMVALNTQLLCTLRKADAHRATMQQSTENQRVNRGITVIVVTIVLFYLVCNVCAMLGLLFYSLAEGFSQLKYLDKARRYIAIVSSVMIVFNSSVNFVIYSLCSRNFRLVLVRMCRCRSGSDVRGAGSRRMNNTGVTYFSLVRSSTAKSHVDSHIKRNGK